ncbi:MAG: Glyceraldehyde-3-phosphate dehydrogenase, type I [candidate division TM6 bacterium GW2011_GWF2_30_66]|jgi:glyceraldehyde 3-phosphate dehydrogenase|nr:MAG: Glyceraldehyde-3-phosphate dehydrogenase, type I [candidate division TM6 bacterium GW2011_GWF2_30_66]
MVNVAINGFGRIGRNFLRAVLQDKSCHEKIKVVVINVGNANIDYIAHMFRYDTLLGIYPGDVQIKNNELIIDGYKIAIISELDINKIDWRKYLVGWVVDATGKFTDRAGAQLHINSGAKKVLITAPGNDEDVTIIPGVNYQDYIPTKHNIVSLGSCTTNAIAPILKVLHENFIIERGFMTTIHAYTNDQVLLDVEKKDLRRARAAALNIIPTTTGAQKVVGKVLPELNGLIGGTAIRVPVGKVSLIDLSFNAKKEITVEKINKAFELASKSGQLAGIMSVICEQLVSSDFSGNNNSVIIDSLLTDVEQNMGKVFGWYDNEWGYSVRLKDFLLKVN